MLPSYIPVAVASSDEAHALSRALAHHLGDNLYQRRPDRYPTADVPAVLKDGNGYSAPPRSGNGPGPTIAFHNGGPFAGITLMQFDEGWGVSYYGESAYEKYGTQADLRAYFDAFDTLLTELDALYDGYRVTCPCGYSAPVDGSFVAVRDAYKAHNDSHDEQRLSNATLTGRQTYPITSVSDAPQTDSHTHESQADSSTHQYEEQQS